MTPRTWIEAATIGELAELTAQWLEGHLEDGHPGGYDVPALETGQITQPLIELNRAGFCTECSQPGEAASWGSQRAYVSGYCEEGIASRLADMGTFSDLIVLAHPPGHNAYAPIPITRSDDGPHTIANSWIAGDLGFEGINLSAKLALVAGWYVEVLDAVWGRNDVLWPAAVEALQLGPLTTRSPWFGPEDLGSS